MLLIVSVFVAIIIRYYNLQSQMLVSSTDIQNFARLWVFFDRRNTNYIRVEKVGALLLQAAPPLVSVRRVRVRDDTRLLEQQNWARTSPASASPSAAARCLPRAAHRARRHARRLPAAAQAKRCRRACSPGGR